MAPQSIYDHRMMVMVTTMMINTLIYLVFFNGKVYSVFWGRNYTSIHAYLKNTVNLISDHNNKANSTVK